MMFAFTFFVHAIKLEQTFFKLQCIQPIDLELLPFDRIV